jgi:hypothetical protein
MLVHEFNRIFSDLKHPGDDALAEREPSEWDGTIQRLKGKSWRNVALDDFESQSGVIEGVQALSPRGFIYFLPGLVKIALTNPDARDTVTSALLPWFTVPDYLDQERRDSGVLSLLSPGQRRFLISFFAEMQKTESDLCAPMVDSAIANLKAGEMSPYKQEDVKRWVSTKTQELA